MKVTYLCHSGFSVELPARVLIFDYYKGRLPVFDRRKTAYIFVSHNHGDHYNHDIFRLRSYFEKLYYIISDDVPQPKRQGYVPARQSQTLKVAAAEVVTLPSTDEGVAFIVTIEGVRIYHAGDLNWWHWEGESQAYNEQMSRNYRQFLAPLTHTHLDLGFVPLDPRLNGAYARGLDYFARLTECDHIFPMHMWDKYYVVDKLLKDNISKPYRSRIEPVRFEGQIFEY